MELSELKCKSDQIFEIEAMLLKQVKESLNVLMGGCETCKDSEGCKVKSGKSEVHSLMKKEVDLMAERAMLPIRLILAMAMAGGEISPLEAETINEAYELSLLKKRLFKSLDETRIKAEANPDAPFGMPDLSEMLDSLGVPDFPDMGKEYQC